jgi:hypothetical protein
LKNIREVNYYLSVINNLPPRAVGPESVRGREQEKPRGLEMAALARSKHERDQDQAPTLAELPAPPAVVVELGRSEPPAAPYARPAAVPGPEVEKVSAKEKESPKLVAPENGDGGGKLVMGEGSSLHLNVHADQVDSGAGTIVLGENASAHINVHADSIEGGGGTLVLGEGASLHLDVHAQTLATGGRLEVPDGAHVEIKVREGEVGEAANGPAPKAEPQDGGKEAAEKAAAGPVPDKSSVAAPKPSDSAPHVDDGAAPAAEAGSDSEGRAPAEATGPDRHVYKQPPSRRSAHLDDELRDLRDLRWRLLREVHESVKQTRAKAALDAHETEEHRHVPAKPTRVAEQPGASGGVTTDN